MIRRIIVILLVAATAAGLYFGYQYFYDLKSPTYDPMVAVPGDAALVISGDQAHEVWNKLAGTNIIWAELRSTTTFTELDRLANKLDSIIMSDDQLTPFIQNNPCAISAHVTGGNSYDFLFTAAVPTGMDPTMVQDMIASYFNSVTDQPFGGVHVSVVPYQDRKLQIIVREGALAMTFSRVLIEDVILQMEAGTSIVNNPEFLAMGELGSDDAEVNIYLNFDQLPSVVSMYLSPDAKKVVRPYVDFADAAVFDVAFQSNGVMLNGFSRSSDSAYNYLNVFRGQQGMESNVFGLVPDDAAFMMQYRISDPEQFFMDYRLHLADVGDLQRFESDMAGLNSECGCNLPTYLLTWIGNEITTVVTEPNAQGVTNRYGLFKTTNSATALERLNDLSLLIAETRGEPVFHEWLGDMVVGQIPIDSLHGKLFGHAFSGLTDPYYMQYGDYIVFANSVSALHELVNKVKGERTMIHSESYAQFSENLSATCNIFVYSSTSRSPQLYKEIVAADFVADIDSNLALFRQFEAVAFQVEHHKNDLFLTNVYLKHNPIYKEESASLWEVPLDTLIGAGPFLIDDHTTGAENVIVQDQVNDLYMISNTGQILWKYALDGPMLGDVVQVDAYKNGKLQLLLNTGSTLYMIDRLGRDVEGYPVTLPAMAETRVGVIDYENTKDYRFLVPCSNGMVYSYSTFGTPVEGWAFAGAGCPIVTSPVHFSIQSKDYIFFMDEMDRPHVLDRKGAVRYQVQGAIEAKAVNSPIYLELGKNIDETRLVYSDTTGMVVKHMFNGTMNRTAFLPASSEHEFVFADADGDGINDFLFSDSTRVWLYGADEQLKFELHFDHVVGEFAQVPRSGHISVLDTAASLIYLFDIDGVLFGEMPYNGGSAMQVSDINKDGTMNVVVGDGRKVVITYNLH